MKKLNHAVIVDVCSKRLAALKAYVTPKTEIPVNGAPQKLAHVIAVYQQCLDTRAVLAAKRAEVAAALIEMESADAARLQTDRALKPWVVNTFGVGSNQAREFGFLPPKSPTRTAKSKLDAVLLGQATRKARNTMGPKQRLEVKGSLPEPVASPAPPASPPRGAIAVTPPVVTTSPVASTPASNGALNGASNGALNGASPHA